MIAGDGARGAQLIAVDGERGRDIVLRAEQVRHRAARKRKDAHAAISRWDASGTFYELRCAGKKALTLTPRTLLLLYAADLAFRLRWEIEPALEAGRTVIAAPYVDTAIAFGTAAGLPRKWIVELLRFAPRPGVRIDAAGSRKSSRKGRPADGFVEFAALAAKSLRQRTRAALAQDR